MAITEVGSEFGGYEPPEYNVPGSINQSFFDEYKSKMSQQESGDIKGSIGTLDSSIKGLTREYSFAKTTEKRNIGMSEKLSSSLDKLTEGTYKLGSTFESAIGSIGGFTKNIVETTGNTLTSTGRVVKKAGRGASAVGGVAGRTTGTVFGTQRIAAQEGTQAFKDYAGSIKDVIPMMFGGPLGAQIVGSIAGAAAHVVSSTLKGLFGLGVSAYKIGKWAIGKGFDVGKGAFKIGKGAFDIGVGAISKSLGFAKGLITGDKKENKKLVQTSGGSVMASGSGDLVDPNKYKPFLKDLKLDMSEAFHSPPKKLSPKSTSKAEMSALEDEDKYQGFLKNLKTTMSEVFTGYHKGVFGEWGGRSSIRMLVANILPVWGAQYRAELPRIQRYGMIGCMYKLLQMIYVSSRFSAKENNDLLVQIGRNQMIAHGLEGTFKTPKARSLPELLGQKFGGFLKDKFEIDKKLEEVRSWVHNQLPEKIKEQFKPDEPKTKEVSPMFTQQIELLSSIDKRLLFIQNHLSVSKKYLFDIRDFFENINKYQEGGLVKKTEIAVVHEGEVVVPKNKVNNSAKSENEEQEEKPGGLFSRMFGGIVNFFTGGFFKNIQTAFDSMIKFFTGKEPIGGDKAISATVKPISERITDFFDNVYKGIIDTVKPSFDSLIDEMKKMWDLGETPISSINKELTKIKSGLDSETEREETLAGLKSKGITEKEILDIIQKEKEGKIGAHEKRTEFSDIGKRLGLSEDKGFTKALGMIPYTVELAIEVIKEPVVKFRDEIYRIRQEMEKEGDAFKPEGLLDKALTKLPKSMLKLFFGDLSDPYMEASVFKESSLKKVGLIGAIFSMFRALVTVSEVPINITKTFLSSWETFVETMKSDEATILSKIKSFVTTLAWEGLVKNIFGALFTAWSESMMFTSPGWIVGVISKSKIPDIIHNFGENVAKIITKDKKIQGMIEGAFKTIGEAIYDFVMISWRNFTNVMSSLMGDVEELKESGKVFGKRLKTFKEAVADAKIFEEDDNILKQAVNMLSGSLAGGATLIAGYFQPYLQLFANLKENLEETFKEPIDKFKNWINETFSESFLGKVKTVFDYIVNAIDRITNMTHKSIEPLPARAEGSPPGGEPKDSLALVGEKGAEIVNLPKNSNVNTTQDTTDMFKTAIDSSKLAESVFKIENMLFKQSLSLLGLAKTGVMIPVKIAGFGIKAIKGLYGLLRKDKKQEMEDYMERADTSKSGPLSFIANKLAELAGGIRDLTYATLGGIRSIGKTISGTISKGFTSLKEYLSGLGERIGNILTPVKNFIKGAFSVITSPLKHLEEWASAKIASVKDKAVRWLKGEYIVAIDQDNKPVYDKWPGRIIGLLANIRNILAKKSSSLSGIAEIAEDRQEEREGGRLQRMFDKLGSKRGSKSETKEVGGKGMLGTALDALQINPQMIGMIGSALKFTAIIGGTLAAGAIGAGAGNMLGGAIFGEGENQQALGSIGSVAGGILGGILAAPLGPMGIPLGVGIGSFLGGILGQGIGAIGSLGEMLGLPDFIVKGGMGAMMGAVLGGLIALPTGVGIPLGIGIGAAVGGLIGTGVSAFKAEADDGSFFGYFKGISKRFKEGGKITKTLGLLGMIVGMAGGPVLSAMLMNTGLKLGGFIEGAYKEGSADGGGVMGGLKNIWKKVAGWVFDRIPVVGGILKELILGESTEGSERLRMVGQQKGFGGLITEYISQWVEYVPFVGKWIANKIRSMAGIESMEEMREKDEQETGKPKSLRGVIAQFLLDKLPGGWLLNKIPGMGWVKKKILSWGGIKDDDSQPVEKENEVKGTISEKDQPTEKENEVKGTISEKDQPTEKENEIKPWWDIKGKVDKFGKDLANSDWGKVGKAGAALYYKMHPEELEKRKAQLAKENVAMNSDKLSSNYIGQERARQEIEKKNMKANFDEYRQQQRQDQVQQDIKSRIKEKFANVNASQNNMTSVNNVSSNISSPSATNVYNSVTPYSEGYAMI